MGAYKYMRERVRAFVVYARPYYILLYINIYSRYRFLSNTDHPHAACKI